MIEVIALQFLTVVVLLVLFFVMVAIGNLVSFIGRVIREVFSG